MAKTSSREQAGNALERLSDVIFDLAPIGIEIYDAEGRLLEANPKCLELFGVCDAALVMGFRLFDDPNISAERRAMLQKGTPIAYEARFDFDLVKAQGLYPTTRSGSIMLSVTIEPVRQSPEDPVTSYLVLVQDMTERMRTEEELRREKRLFSMLLENSPIHIFFKDRELRALRLSRNYERMLGMPLDKALGKTMDDLFPSELARSMMADDRKIMEQGALVKVEEELGGRHYETIKFPVTTEDEGTLLVGFTTDITEKKLADLALRESEERFRKGFEESRIGMVIVNRQFHFQRANAAFCNMLGYSEDELHRLSFKDITHAEHLDSDVANVMRILAGELSVYKTEKRYLRKDGKAVWGSTSVSAIRNQKGDFLNFLTTVEDITERKRAEKELAETTERLALATRSGRLGIWDWYVEENIMVWDDRMLELYGLTHDTFTGTVEAWNKGLHPDDKERATRECERALAGEQDFDTEFRVVHPDGKVVTIKANGMVLRDGQGKPQRMIGINADITERTRTEETLQNAQRLESLGLLAGGIAHDFNNLLTGIFGFTELAREEARDELVADYLGRTLSTIDRARALTRQLLTFAKGGAPVQKVGPLFPFVQETALFALSGSNVTCRFDVEAGLWPCNFDKNQIGQVIDNLVINALQAMPSGGTIDIGARNVELGHGDLPGLAAGKYVRISVRDSGIGIARELLSRVFDPFYTTKAKGHGLGLATCYSIVRRHGGCIEVDSEPAKGSTFHVHLPAAAMPAAAVVEESPTTASMRRGSGTFLLMDDEDVVRKVTGHMLESLGYRVLSREDGRGAVELFQEERKAGRSFCGMIFDLTIPGGMGGEEAVRIIRGLDTQVPVFVASGYAEDPVMARPRDYGFTASIRKPFRKSDLEELLRRHLDHDHKKAS